MQLQPIAKGRISAILLMVSCSHLYSSPSAIRTAAEQNARALMIGDFETVVSGTYSPVVKSLGGPEQMVNLLRSVADHATTAGIRFAEVTMGDPRPIVKSGDISTALVPQRITISTPSGTLVQTSFLLAVSSGSSREWSFVDLGGMTSEAFSLNFPELAEFVEFPTPPSVINRQVE